MTVKLEFSANSPVYSLPMAVNQLQKVMNTFAERHPELKVKAVSVS